MLSDFERLSHIEKALFFAEALDQLPLGLLKYVRLVCDERIRSREAEMDDLAHAVLEEQANDLSNTLKAEIRPRPSIA